MVFSSIPAAYLDPSSNWQQLQVQGHQVIGNGSGGGGNPFMLAPPPMPPHGSIRPGSMAERARMANIPMPEAALKCPRCESTNTKFCYFNNYSLSQPRHFCKTCRRYWTRGGALRSVPVGGGCRRNKRSSKPSSSKSSASTAGDSSGQGTNNSSNSNNDNNSLIPSSNAIQNMNQSEGVGVSQPRFMPPPLSHLTENFGGDLLHHHHNMAFGGASYLIPSDLGFHGSTGLLAGNVSSSNSEPWRLLQQVQNFPPFVAMEQPYQLFHGGDLSHLTADHHHSSRPKFSEPMPRQMAVGSVKMEENHPELNLSTQMLAGGNMSAGNEQWPPGTTPGGPIWTDLSGFTSFSTSNPL